VSVLEVFDLEDPRWANVVTDARADLFYRPEFCRFRFEGQEHRPVLFHYKDALGCVFDVTTIREVARLPFYASVADEFQRSPIDLASPEYNGPVVIGEPRAELYARYKAAVNDWCHESGVVTEFVRFHPFAQEVDAALPVVSELVYADLREGYQPAAMRYSENHRRNVRKAARDGAKMAIVEPDEARISQFSSLYLQTMERRQAKSVYLFQPAYFASMFRHLGSRAILVESYTGAGALASMAVFFLGDAHVWYMYGATIEAERAGGANTFMFDQLFAWAAERGYSWFVLGGGFQPGDGLYRFKLGLSPLSRPVRHLRKVHDATTLERLTAAKAAYDARHGRPPRTDYFPPYWL
jgi:serine/alanine adding enzyme